MPIKLNSAGGGSVTINAASTASATVLTVPATNANLVTTGDSGSITQTMLGSGLAGNGPAFSAYQTSAQNISSINTWTKLQFGSKEWDTASCFDATTNYRFTPNVAGYYQVSGGFGMATTPCGVYVAVYKNGSIAKKLAATGGSQYAIYGSAMVYLNGSTDYIELYGQLSTAQNTNGGSVYDAYFQAFLARSA